MTLGTLSATIPFTHHNMIENSDNRSYAELKLTRMLIESVTGHSTILFRAPYNADADPTDHEEIWPMIVASRRNYLFVGESIDPNDWQQNVTADQIYQRVIDGVHHEDGHIILLHDAGGDTRKPTMKLSLVSLRPYNMKVISSFLSNNT